MSDVLLALCVVCLVAGLLLWTMVRRQRRRSGLPQGSIRYSDTGGTRPPVLYSERLGLSGRPDYLVERGRHLIPVEVKSTRAPAQPHASHVVQAMAYCLLVEEATGRRPPYAIIRYADRSFQVKNEAHARREVVETLQEMRLQLAQLDAPAGTDDARRCRHCSYRAACGRQG